MELSLQQKYSKSKIHEILVDEFNIHEFTVKRLARETRQMCKHKNFNWMLESRLLWGRNTRALSGLREAVREIVVSERLFFSAGFRVASQKNLVQEILTEKEETDVRYRILNQQYANKIEKYLESEPKLQRIGKNSLILIGKDVDEKLEDLVIIFRPASKGARYSYGHLTQDKQISAIVLPLLSGRYEQLHLADRFGAHKEEFGHEFTHYIDAKRRKSGKQASTTILRDKGEKAYYNTPEEFNAYYQEGTTKLLKIAKGLKNTDIRIKSKLFPPDFKKFMKGDERPKKIWGKDFIEKLNPKYKKKFAKRVADLFPKIINTVYTDKERKSLQRHFAKKKAEQNFYCT